MTAPIVVEAVRSGFTESAHEVDVAVVDVAGVLVAWAGDPERAAAFRSSAKPLQAQVAIEAGWEPRDDRALAIACASHNGEPEHVDAVRDVLSAAGLEEDALRCPADVPFHPPSVLAATEARRITHNCSGKHASMLAACVASGQPLETYRDAQHPLQMAIAARMRHALGCEPQVLIDGCGVPTFVAPLRALAIAFAAVPGSREGDAMRAHPHLVGGTARFDTDVMTARAGLVAKAGAEGLGCVATDDVSIAIKARDGAARARGPAMLHVLDALGIDVPRVEHHRATPVLGGGEPVGTLRARGELARA